MGRIPSAQKTVFSIPSIEFLGMLGFGLHLGWLLIAFFWLFSAPEAHSFSAHHDFTQLWLFVGNACGFVLMALLCRFTSFTPFKPAAYAVDILGTIVLPLVALLPDQLVSGQNILVGIISFVAGLASAFITVAWLDICSRLKTRQYGRFMGISFLIGGALFAIAALLPYYAGTLISLVCALASIALIAFTTRTAHGNDTCAPLTSFRSLWRFQHEVEPSLFVFGITFGMTFAWLFTAGDTAVFIGLCGIIPGALCIALLSLFKVNVNITMLLRILLCLCVFACVFMPQSDEFGRLACSFLIIAAWAMFSAMNYAFIVRKSVVIHDCPCFRVAPLRLSIPASGFATGWLVICIATYLFGVGADEFITIRLAFAVLLVVVFALFFPSQEHHSLDGSHSSPTGLDEKESFELRILGIAKQYGLSPRETEVLRFLAKGRNAAFICDKLVVSLHTVRTHMYNIYRKLDVHSQQAVIDLTENFPVDTKNLT